MIFNLIQEHIQEKIQLPAWFYTGIALIVISCTNIHYLHLKMNKNNNKNLLKFMFTIANASVLFGALLYQQNE